MTIFEDALDGMSVEQAARSNEARALLGDLFDQMDPSPSEEVLVPVQSFWDVRSQLPDRAQNVWDNRESLGKQNPTYQVVSTQTGVDERNSYVAHAAINKGRGLTVIPGGDLMLFGPPAAYLSAAILIGVWAGEFLIPLLVAVLGIVGGFFIGGKLMEGKNRRHANSPDRHWYTTDELETSLSRPVRFDGQGEELKLIRLVSILRLSLVEMRAWNEDILSIARAGFDLDFETLNIIARASAIVEHGQWLAEYAEVQRVRGAFDEQEIDVKLEENDAAFDVLVDRVSEMVSLYYSVSDLDMRMRAEEKLVSLTQDSRELGLTSSLPGSALDMSEKVDATHGAYKESVDLANSKIERLMVEV